MEISAQQNSAKERNETALKLLKTNDSAKWLISRLNDINDLRTPREALSFAWRRIPFVLPLKMQDALPVGMGEILRSHSGEEERAFNP
jgi:hypothetical protein